MPKGNGWKEPRGFCIEDLSTLTLKDCVCLAQVNWAKVLGEPDVEFEKRLMPYE